MLRLHKRANDRSDGDRASFVERAVMIAVAVAFILVGVAAFMAPR